MGSIKRFFLTYEQVFALTPCTPTACWQHVRRGDLDLDNLTSVLFFLARHGHFDLRVRVLKYAIEGYLTEKPGRRKAPGKPAKRLPPDALPKGKRKPKR